MSDNIYPQCGAKLGIKKDENGTKYPWCSICYYPDVLRLNRKVEH